MRIKIKFVAYLFVTLSHDLLRFQAKTEVSKACRSTFACASLFILTFTVKPGVRYREMGNIIQKHAQAHGYSVVRSYCGHGIHQ